MYKNDTSYCFVIPQLFTALFSYCLATGEGVTQEKKHIYGIVCSIDLLNYLLQNNPDN